MIRCYYELGVFLKQQRQKLHLSMSEVHGQTGITDSKLSRIEHGEGRPLDTLELKSLLIYTMLIL